ncbi:hypothetical protein NCS56_00813400 [Fusarium sp. Ph1]|nr:hypothetical protein NCS56_00813400 [Fusarium sp. Ph1]
MPVIHVEIDTDGDTLIILPHPKPGPDAEESKEEEENDEEPEAEEPGSQDPDVEKPDPQTCFKVSMKHLTLASPRAKKMFGGNYTEAQPDADGLRRWTFGPIFDPAAFEIVMNAIHGYTHKMPWTVTLETLAKISAIVDDLDCAQSLWFFAKTWIAELDTHMNDDNVRWWMLISFVFDEQEQFYSATLDAILEGDGPFDARGLPIRPKIIDTIDSWRKTYIKRIVNGIESLVVSVRGQKCDHECKSMTFGALTLYLMSANLIFPSPSEPYPGMRLSRILRQLTLFELPLVYRPGESFLHNVKRSKDLWLFQEAPAPGVQPQKQPQGTDTHNCDLRSLVTKSLSSLAITASGLNLSDFR